MAQNEKKEKPNFLAGLINGAMQSIVFHPYDRALFISNLKKQPFLTPHNFSTPFYGLFSTIVERSIRNGLYFSLQDLFTIKINDWIPVENRRARGCLVGILSGSIYAVLMCPMTAVKYQMWRGQISIEQRDHFLNSALKMYSNGGFRPFLIGLRVTLLRDATFGLIYEGIRDSETTSEQGHSFVDRMFTNASSAGIATLFSAPFNYSRLKIFQTVPGEKPKSIVQTFQSLLHSIERQGHAKGPLAALGYAQMRLNIGWGTLRVCLAMSIGQELNSIIKQNMESG